VPFGPMEGRELYRARSPGSGGNQKMRESGLSLSAIVEKIQPGSGMDEVSFQQD